MSGAHDGGKAMGNGNGQWAMGNGNAKAKEAENEMNVPLALSAVRDKGSRLGSCKQRRMLRTAV